MNSLDVTVITAVTDCPSRDMIIPIGCVLSLKSLPENKTIKAH